MKAKQQIVEFHLTYQPIKEDGDGPVGRVGGAVARQGQEYFVLGVSESMSA